MLDQPWRHLFHQYAKMYYYDRIIMTEFIIDQSSEAVLEVVGSRLDRYIWRSPPSRVVHWREGRWLGWQHHCCKGHRIRTDLQYMTVNRTWHTFPGADRCHSGCIWPAREIAERWRRLPWCLSVKALVSLRAAEKWARKKRGASSSQNHLFGRDL